MKHHSLTGWLESSMRIGLPIGIGLFGIWVAYELITLLAPFLAVVVVALGFILYRRRMH